VIFIFIEILIKEMFPFYVHIFDCNKLSQLIWPHNRKKEEGEVATAAQ